MSAHISRETYGAIAILGVRSQSVQRNPSEVRRQHFFKLEGIQFADYKFRGGCRYALIAVVDAHASNPIAEAQERAGESFAGFD